MRRRRIRIAATRRRHTQPAIAAIDAPAWARQWRGLGGLRPEKNVIGKWLGTGAMALWAGAALAGPPYATDDPEPTDTGHWEIYAFAAGTFRHGEFEGATGLDLNYGPVRDIQLTATLPVDFSHDGGTHAGAGDVELGVKYRFLHDERAGFSFAIFPRVILPTASRRFGTGRARLLLPAWAQKHFGPWSLFGGGGYTLNPGAGNRDFWQSGIALTREVAPGLSLGAEVTHQSPDEAGGRGTTALGAGGIVHIAGSFSLLFSGGPVFAHRGGPGVNLYLALGLSY